jgi:hypothetical protein
LDPDFTTVPVCGQESNIYFGRKKIMPEWKMLEVKKKTILLYFVIGVAYKTR